MLSYLSELLNVRFRNVLLVFVKLGSEINFRLFVARIYLVL
jgi:hypothetical protein